jgi:hypothetical protein
MLAIFPRKKTALPGDFRGDFCRAGVIFCGESVFLEKPKRSWWAVQGLNLRPPVCKTVAGRGVDRGEGFCFDSPFCSCYSFSILAVREKQKIGEPRESGTKNI